MPILKNKKGLKSIIYSNQMSGKYGIMLRKGEKEVDVRMVTNILRFKGFTISIEGASQVVLMVNNSPATAGDIRDTCSIPGLGRSPGERKGNPLHYSCLETPMDRGAWQATQSIGSQRVGND